MQNKPKIIVQAILLFAMAALFAVVPILSLQQEEITPYHHYGNRNRQLYKETG